jgi:hypothetical protein
MRDFVAIVALFVVALGALGWMIRQAMTMPLHP